MRVALAVSVCLVSSVLFAQAAEIPDETSGWEPGPRHIWYLNFRYQKPKMITVGQEFANPRIYWYMLFSLENLDAEDHEIFVDLRAFSDKDVEYINVYEEDVYKVIVWKEGKKEWKGVEDNGKPGVLHHVHAYTFMPNLKELSGPVTKVWERKPLVQSKTHGDPDDLNLPVIKAGQKWECVAIFKTAYDAKTERFRIRPHGRYAWDLEMHHLRIRVSGLTEDFKIITHEDRLQAEEYLHKDLLLLRDGTEVWCRVREVMIDAYRIEQRTKGKKTEKVVPKMKVWRYLKWDAAKLRKGMREKENDLSPYMRLVVEKYFDIVYERTGGDVLPGGNPLKFVRDGWVEDWRIVRDDLPFERSWDRFMEGVKQLPPIMP